MKPPRSLDVSVVAKIVFAWIPFFALWSLFILGYGGGNLRGALFSGLIATTSAALLAIGVWRFSGRYAWPDTIRIPFYAVHLVAGTLYAVVWTAMAPLVGILLDGMSLAEVFQNLPIYYWRLLMGILLYVLIIGVSYALRNRDQTRRQEQIAARAEAVAAQARLQALKAQLHPHFLFNALHSVSALIRIDPEQAEEAMEQLGDLLRYALEERGEDFVRLRDEWDFTAGYLRLQQLRFGERLQVESTVEAPALDCPIPPFTVQPLVENAVHHGVDCRAEGGRIAVTIRTQDDRLMITVRDDGPGLDSSPSTRSNGQGLAVLRERLEALYGRQSVLLLEGSAEGGTVATLLLPPCPAS